MEAIRRALRVLGATALDHWVALSAVKKKERERRQKRMERNVIRVVIEYDPVQRNCNIDCPPDLLLTFGILAYAQGVLSRQIGAPEPTVVVPKLVKPT